MTLLMNALDNTLSGKVDIIMTSDEEWIHFNVKDTGVGIDEHDRERLFCPFMKFPNKLKPEHGVGIGLFNMAWRVRSLGGTYSMSSNPESSGSIFYFRVPLRKAQYIKLAISTRRDGLSMLKVLIVDDMTLFCDLFARQLNARGIDQVTRKYDGDAGLSELCTNEYDIAFVDLHMPTLNGDACIRMYRERHPRGRTKCALMSADVIQHRGEWDYTLQKPINIPVVLEILCTLVV